MNSELLATPVNRSHMLPAIEQDYEWSINDAGQILASTRLMLSQARAELAAAQRVIDEQKAHIDNLERVATTDEMTGIKNRRGFRQSFDAELDRTERGLSNGGILVLIDLDNFKYINDSSGHLAGDACLKLVAKTLAQEVRVMDTAARLGGDEFVVLMADTTPEDATARIHQLGLKLNRLSLEWQGKHIPVRASIGIKAYAKGISATDVFSAADDALYAQKQLRTKK